MTPQTPESKILGTFKTALAAAYPLRIVTRSLKDYADRPPAELKAGVFTIVTVGQTGADVFDQMLKFMVVGQVQLHEKATGEEIEEIELIMAREIKNLIQRQLYGPLMRITGIDHSAQLETPYGWVSVAVECGPYDATEPLTLDETIGHLTDFLTFQADIDINQPHQSAAEHSKWAADVPDYTTSQPDAQLRVDIPRSTP
ncbi:hypothetical protein [Herminiimonas sp. CN]|uniref:hypothetical protein n=1 Tax=Herminiimonas sp. CN TaxID=1349818 RepID=UPI000473514D|nr:hypothetical protein [Herminiimonas sp. CN]